MKIFIANCTNQVQLFSCRILEERKPRTVAILLGRQVCLSGELTKEQVDEVVNQHVRYGLIPVTEAATWKAYAPLVFSVDRPVPSTLMNKRIELNKLVLKERGARFRREAAIAAATYIKNNVTHQEGDDPDSFPKAVEFEAVEQASRMHPKPEEINETIRVDRRPGGVSSDPAPEMGRRKRKPAAA